MLACVLPRFYFAIYLPKHWVIGGAEYVLGLVAEITGWSLKDGELIPKHDNAASRAGASAARACPTAHEK